MARKALVTGAAGFIGKHVTTLLLQAGWDVCGLDLLPRPDTLDCAWQQASILDDVALRAAMKGRETVFHLAAYAHLFANDPAVFDQVNHQGTQFVIAAALKEGVQHLIATLSAVAITPVGHTGLIDVLGQRPSPAQLAGPYAVSKWRADQALSQVKTSDMAITRLFPTVPIGPGDDAFTAPTQMVHMFLNTPPPAILRTTLNLVNVKHVAAAHIAAAERLSRDTDNHQRQYSLAGERWPLSALLDHLEALTGKPMPKHAIPYAIARVAASVSERIARLRGLESLATIEGVRLAKADALYNTQSAQIKLGWSPSPAVLAIDALVQWLAERPPKRST